MMSAYLRASSSTPLIRQRRQYRTVQTLFKCSGLNNRVVLVGASNLDTSSSSSSVRLHNTNRISSLTRPFVCFPNSSVFSSSCFDPYHKNNRNNNQQQQQQQQRGYHPTTSPFHVGGSGDSSCGIGTPDDKQAKGSDRDEQLRIAQMFFRHVWPTPTPTSTAVTATATTTTPSSSSKDDSYTVTPAHAQTVKRRVLYSLGLMIGGKAVTIQVPFLFKHIVDTLPVTIHTTDLASLSAASTTTTLPLALILGYGISRATAAGMQELRNATFAHVAQETIRRVGTSTFRHLHNLDATYHLSRNTGTLGRVLDRGNRSISFVLNAMVFNVVPTVVEVGVVTGLMAVQFGTVHSGIVAATIVGYTGYTVGITTWRTQFRRDMNRLENEASGKVSDSLLNYDTVKYFNNEEHEVRRYEENLRGYQNAAIQAQQSLSLLNFGQNAIFSAGLTAIMYVTTDMIVSGQASVGDLVLVNGLLFQLSVPLNFIGSVYREVKQAFVDMEAVFALKNTVPELRDSPDARTYDPRCPNNNTNETNDGTVVGGTDITFTDVGFAYPAIDERRTRSVLKGLTFHVREGRTVALVGSSGCGKSTILRLLYRFYESDRGSIAIGGHNVRDLTAESVRRAIAVVPQDTVLFNESIEYNIRYGNLEASMEEVVEAAKKARIHDTILRFPDGYNTKVGERGLKLSGGEKQRVAIARAILKKAPILLCDEPTSSLDSQTEMDIMNNLKEVGEKNTTLIIAHRLSTIQDCDEIIVLNEGCVVERGTHDELLAKGSRYNELLKMQQQQQQQQQQQRAEGDGDVESFTKT